MRVPTLLVISLIISVLGGTWWWNTRNIDFMTPPSEAKLQEIRVRVESSFPRADEVEEEVPEVVKKPEPPPPVEPPKPVVDTGDLTTPPALQDYGVRAPDGPEKMTELALALEEKGEFQRALLAWERILDLTKPDESQRATATAAIKRLRPTLPDWNTKPEAALQIILHAGTGSKQAKALKPILDAVALDLARASSGIIKVKPVITAGKASAKGATPVALRLAGPDKKSSSTETLSFTVQSPDAMRDEILKSVYVLLSNHVARSTAYTPPPSLPSGEAPLDALSFRVTRLCWSEVAAALKLPAKKPK